MISDKSVGTTLCHVVRVEDFSVAGIYQPPSTSFPASILETLGRCSVVVGDANAYLDGQQFSVRDRQLSSWLGTSEHVSISDLCSKRDFTRHCGPDICLVKSDIEDLIPVVSLGRLQVDHYALELDFEGLESRSTTTTEATRMTIFRTNHLRGPERGVR